MRVDTWGHPQRDQIWTGAPPTAGAQEYVRANLPHEQVPQPSSRMSTDIHRQYLTVRLRVRAQHPSTGWLAQQERVVTAKTAPTPPSCCSMNIGGTALKPSSAVDNPCATRSVHAVYACAKRSTHPWCCPENRSEAPRSRRGRTVEHFLLPCKIAWALHEAHAWELQWCSARRRDRDLHIKYSQQHHLASARTPEDAVWECRASLLCAQRMDMRKALELAPLESTRLQAVDCIGRERCIGLCACDR